ncbi:MAG: DUF1810 domain-containing protein [Endomicrobium sp.]|jgi:uncharacterized protein (DUF1810 family)|nr:DUF1810 domain-containing protein [Endomicrobium sp.]
MRNIKSIILFSISVSLACLLSSCAKHLDNNNTRTENYYRGNPRYISDYNSKVIGLERFHVAQNQKMLEIVNKELTVGRKKSHWIWYIFPQIKGLGASSASEYYGIYSLEEARQYLEDSVLSDRLIKHTGLVLNFRNSRTLEQIFGSIDRQKFISSMTLFNQASIVNGVNNSIFNRALQAFNNGREDAKTLQILGLLN